MPFVVELYFDPSTEERIRGAWKVIDEAGVSDSIAQRGLTVHISHLGCAIILKQIHLHKSFQPLRQVLHRFDCRSPI